MTVPLLSEALLIVFDTETTGVDTEEDRVAELGLCYFRGGALVTPPVNIRINPGIPIPVEASKIHGIYDADVAAAPSFAALAERFEAHLSGAWAAKHIGGDGRPPILVGYNAQHFDAPILNAELRRAGSSARIDPELVIDPIWASRQWARGGGGKLTHVCEAFGITLDNAHAAWADAAATGELLHALVMDFWLRDPLDQAFEDLARWKARDSKDRDRWLWYLFTDRHGSGELMVGFGKNKGRPLRAISRSDAAWIAGLDGVPEEALRHFKARAKGAEDFDI